MQRLSRPRYADDFRFEDPLQRQTSFQAFQTNLRLLRAVFDIKFIVHEVEAEGDSQVTSWWVPACTFLVSLLWSQTRHWPGLCSLNSLWSTFPRS